MRLLKANDVENEIQGIGIGAPNANYYTGEIQNAPNLPWGNGILPLAEKVSIAFNGIPVAVTNDANAAALGEMTYGAELRHVIMKRNNGRVCGCGRTGCLEAYCSATGVARTAREFLEVRTDPSTLRNINIEDITSKDVYDAAVAGDKLAKEIFEYTGRILGEAFADFVAFSSPQAIVLFGGLAKSGDLLLRPLRESFEKSLFGIYRGKTKIILSELKESDAAVLGASALGWEAKFRVETPQAYPTAQSPAAAPAAAPVAPSAPEV